MGKKLSLKSIFTCIVLVMLLAAVAIRGGAFLSSGKTPQETVILQLSDIRSIFPDAVSFIHNSDQSILVKDKAGKEIGQLLCSADFGIHNMGYAGEVPLLIILNDTREVKGIHLLNNQESEEYIEHIRNEKLLQQWNGLTLSNFFVAKNVDAVSGATFSSNAIIKTVKETVAAYLNVQQISNRYQSISIVRIILTIILLALSLSVLFIQKLKKYYWHYLFFVFIVSGLYLKQMLSLGLMHNWLVKGVSIQNNIELIAILILSIIMSLTGRRKYYCNYLCPMGAMQMLIAKVTPFKKRSFNFKISVVTMQEIYFTFIWASLILGFSLPLYNMEPFIAFSFSVASYIMLAAGGIIIILSLFFNRPWCQLCPTGCLLDVVPTVATKTKE